MPHLDPNNIDTATATAIAAARTGGANCHILTYYRLASTNLTAKQLSDTLPDTALILVAEQSAGRGRLGRSFFSPGATGLYMSLFLRRDLPAAIAPRLTTLAAVATSQAVEAEIARPVSIKWVNDLYLDGRKVCGILTEGAMVPGTDRLNYAVVGIGVNLTPPEGGFPPELAGIAGAILPCGADVAALRPHLAAAILDRLLPLVDTVLPGGPEERRVWEAYRSRQMLLGRPVTVHRGDTVCPATALDIDRDYRLIVRCADGRTEALDSGEVSVRMN